MSGELVENFMKIEFFINWRVDWGLGKSMGTWMSMDSCPMRFLILWDFPKSSVRKRLAAASGATSQLARMKFLFENCLLDPLGLFFLGWDLSSDLKRGFALCWNEITFLRVFCFPVLPFMFY